MICGPLTVWRGSWRIWLLMATMGAVVVAVYVVVVGSKVSGLSESLRGGRMSDVVEAWGEPDRRVSLKWEKCLDEMRGGIAVSATRVFGKGEWSVMELVWEGWLSTTYVWCMELKGVWIVDSGVTVGFMVVF